MTIQDERAAILRTFQKHASMLVHTTEPPNTEIPLELLEHVVTPESRFFMRNNHPMPHIAPSDWRLTLDGLVTQPLSITYDELRQLPSTSYMAVLECTGNGRSRFADPALSAGKVAEGTPWLNGAIGCAAWEGVPVSLLLERAGVQPGAVQAECWSDGGTPFARGVEISKLLDDAILAYAMNGAPLPPAHGGPVRLVVPGWGGINWVKWISRMQVLDRESNSEYNQVSYVLYDEQGQPYGKARQMQVKSLITNIGSGATLAAETHEVRGFAWSPNGGVATVELSANGGASWHQADLL
ncbi:MAG: sulfite oxidase, partial [Chloroflexaceae bacterium]|nr:sulfite oxidase [Chloroflexaceae bacterium]